MSLLITLVSFAIVLGVLVFFHELGHYWVAKRNGIVVEEFGMGYPPRAIKLFRYDGTDFTINWIPFGGFARMKGEDGGDMSPGSFNAASRGARAATLVAGPVMNGLLAILLFAASFMAGFPASVSYPQVTNVAPDSLAAQLGLLPGDVLLEANGEATLVSVDPSLRYQVWQPTEANAATTLTVRRGDSTVEISVPQQRMVPELLESINYRPVLETRILGLAENSPALDNGLEVGDLVYKINDTIVTYDRTLVDLVDESLDQPLVLTAYRHGEWVELTMTPRSDPPSGEGALGVQIGADTRLAYMPFLKSLWQGVVSTGQYIMLVVQLPIMFIAGQVSPSEAQLSGPIGIAKLVGGAAQATIDTGLWFPIWRLSAVLSAALAITNMLPFPALDGGRLLFILIETLRGRRINPEREGLVHMVGFMLLLGLMFYITVQDLRTGTIAIDWHALLGQ
ncbi:MAG TPA: RIP metalloprotease RseP [Caldilineaceae bacterium]|nr:RIP metalloprotease RseP [Caldilineaceae bacterium]